MSKHIHIYSSRSDTSVGTVRVDEHGHAHGDGSVAAENVIHHLNHGVHQTDGEQLLEAVVKKLDDATYVHAAYCHDVDCPLHSSHK